MRWYDTKYFKLPQYDVFLIFHDGEILKAYRDQYGEIVTDELMTGYELDDEMNEIERYYPKDIYVELITHWAKMPRSPNKKIKHMKRARYIDVYGKECGWIYWDDFGLIVRLEYDDGTIDNDIRGHIDINDISESTIEDVEEKEKP